MRLTDRKKRAMTLFQKTLSTSFPKALTEISKSYIPHGILFVNIDVF